MRCSQAVGSTRHSIESMPDGDACYGSCNRLRGRWPPMQTPCQKLAWKLQTPRSLRCISCVCAVPPLGPSYTSSSTCEVKSGLTLHRKSSQQRMSGIGRGTVPKLQVA